MQLAATGMYVTFDGGDDGSVQEGIGAPYPRYVDNGNGTITDTLTGLVWLKMASCVHGDWQSALAVVNQLASGQCGLSDSSRAGEWRMPNRAEIQSLSDRNENNLGAFFDATYVTWDGTLYRSPIFGAFVEANYYWTSTTDAANILDAWAVFSCDWGTYETPKSDLAYSLAVR